MEVHIHIIKGKRELVLVSNNNNNIYTLVPPPNNIYVRNAA